MDALTADHLAAALQEPNVDLLRQVLAVLGTDRTAQVLQETLAYEATGGMLTHDGTRHRTPGGTFFQLLRKHLTARQRYLLFHHGAAQVPTQRTPPPPQILTWDEVHTITQTLATAPAGEARTMKLTLIGRPGKAETRGQAVVFRMQGKPPGTLPRGLPPVPTTPPMTWNVMVALRQWNRVKDSLTANQDDQLIIEGFPLMQGSEHVLLAQSCISLLQQRAQKQSQQQAAQQPEMPTTWP